MGDDVDGWDCDGTHTHQQQPRSSHHRHHHPSRNSEGEDDSYNNNTGHVNEDSSSTATTTTTAAAAVTPPPRRRGGARRSSKGSGGCTTPTTTTTTTTTTTGSSSSGGGGGGSSSSTTVYTSGGGGGASSTGSVGHAGGCGGRDNGVGGGSESGAGGCQSEEQVLSSVGDIEELLLSENSSDDCSGDLEESATASTEAERDCQLDDNNKEEEGRTLGSQEEEDYGTFALYASTNSSCSTPSVSGSSEVTSDSSPLLKSSTNVFAEDFSLLTGQSDKERKRPILGLICKPLTMEAIEKVHELFIKFFSDTSTTSIVLGLLQLRWFYKTEPNHICQPAITDTGFISEIIRGLKYSSGSYGWSLIYGFMGDAKLTNLSTISKIISAIPQGKEATLTALTTHTGLTKSSLVHCQWESGYFNPGHYIAVDDAREVIVVSMRGTFHTRDALTDLVATTAPFFFQGVLGLSHSGILKATLNKFATIDPVLTSVVNAHPTYPVLIVGHSLGGGVAQLFTLLTLSSHPDWKIKCFSFGGANVLSQNLANLPEIRKVIFSIIYGSDVVPRLSYGSLKALKNTIQDIHKQHSPGINTLLKKRPAIHTLLYSGIEKYPDDTLIPGGRVFYLHRCDDQSVWKNTKPDNTQIEPALSPPPPSTPTTSGTLSSETATSLSSSSASLSSLSSSISTTNATAGTTSLSSSTPSITAPTTRSLLRSSSGFISTKEKPVHTATATGNNNKVSKSYHFEEVEPEQFSVVLVTESMFTDHMPSVYENKFEALLSSLNST